VQFFHRLACPASSLTQRPIVAFAPLGRVAPIVLIPQHKPRRSTGHFADAVFRSEPSQFQFSSSEVLSDFNPPLPYSALLILSSYLAILIASAGHLSSFEQV
jgi:hypothetical protein